MPDTLGITYDALRREIGRMLGIGRDYTTWNATKASDVDDIIKSGLRSVYFAVTSTKDGPQTYVWSFLKKRGSITLATNTSSYDLPDDFGGMLTWPTYPADSDRRIIDREVEETIVSLQAKNARSGAPYMAAVRAKAPVANGETQYELLTYPTPDASLNGTQLSFRYVSIPPMLSTSNQKPLGSPMVALAILEACLSEAEKMLWDTEGLHTKKFQDALARSIEFDKLHE